jgi:hypothetical protein
VYSIIGFYQEDFHARFALCFVLRCSSGNVFYTGGSNFQLLTWLESLLIEDKDKVTPSVVLNVQLPFIPSFT